MMCKPWTVTGTVWRTSPLPAEQAFGRQPKLGGLLDETAGTVGWLPNLPVNLEDLPASDQKNWPAQGVPGNIFFR